MSEAAHARLNTADGTVADKARPRPSSSPSHLQTKFRSTYVFTTRPNTAPGVSSSLDLSEKPHRPVYPSVLKQPFSDALEVLCQAFNVKKLSVALCAQDPVPSTIDMQLVDQDSYGAPSPTHALVVLDTPRTVESTGRQPVLYPLFVPINAVIFDQVFNSDLLRHYHAAHKFVDPQPVIYHQTGSIRLPTIVARVPHPPSLPLLVLFGLAPHLKLACLQKPAPRASSIPSVCIVDTPLTPITPSNSLSIESPSQSSHRTRLPSPKPPHPSPHPPLSPPSPATHSSNSNSNSSFSSHSTPPTTPSTTATSFSSTKHPHQTLPTGLLTTYLLPISVIEEFPACTTMSEVFAHTAVSSDEQLQAYVTLNQGIWRNVLLLAPQDTRIVEVVRTAWNVTAEARKERDRWKRVGEGRGEVGVGVCARRRERRRHGGGEDSELSDDEGC
ncbi:hypothetical protein BDY19DRAFT_993045 [Irpex rosettiformis]|uniref:Uncharacterized protein n=1 Tax=Irpex rosettiformis TaxID=378272 RepID=A0ACB8U5B0_9APHY|nr:hypothetical protein BDY19DRAFT_993045 [Irpex rosettiformis]